MIDSASRKSCVRYRLPASLTIAHNLKDRSRLNSEQGLGKIKWAIKGLVSIMY